MFSKIKETFRALAEVGNLGMSQIINLEACMVLTPIDNVRRIVAELEKAHTALQEILDAREWGLADDYTLKQMILNVRGYLYTYKYRLKKLEEEEAKKADAIVGYVDSISGAAPPRRAARR